MVASKPPIKRKTSTGITTAISARDWPRRPRFSRLSWWRISVTLRLQADVNGRVRLYRTQWREESGLPVVGVVDGHTHEVARPIANIARGRRPWFRVDHRRPVELVLVVMGEIRGQVAVAVLVQLVDVDLIDLEEGRAADRGPDGAHDLGVRVSRVPECSRLARSIAGGVPRSADAEHQEDRTRVVEGQGLRGVGSADLR